LPDPADLPDGIGQVWRGVDYAAPTGYRPLQLDLYVPCGVDVAAPVVLFAHGGGWHAGSRRVFCPTWTHWRPDPFCRLVADGFAVASVDYRLSAEATFPAQLDDLRAAVRWLRGRSAQLGVDDRRIVAWGESAGGHLAALLGLSAPDQDGLRVAGVVDWYGPADLLTMAAQAAPDDVADADAADSRESLLIGAPVQDAPGLARRTSPVSHVRRGAPPFHIAHGEKDRFVPAAQSRQLAEALRAAGADVELTVVPDADHMWIGAAQPQRILDAAIRFAHRVTAT
jgi:acetyl esterase/lipase